MFFSLLLACAFASPVAIDIDTQTIPISGTAGKVVQFDPAVQKMSGLIANMMESDIDSDMEDNDTQVQIYSLPKVSRPILEKIALYVLEHKDDASMTQEEMRQEEISEW
jgi:hypothetical protein